MNRKLLIVLIALVLSNCATEAPRVLTPSEVIFIMPGCEELRARDPDADC